MMDISYGPPVPVGERPPVSDTTSKARAADDFCAIAKRLAEIMKEKADTTAAAKG